MGKKLKKEKLAELIGAALLSDPSRTARSTLSSLGLHSSVESAPPPPDPGRRARRHLPAPTPADSRPAPRFNRRLSQTATPPSRRSHLSPSRQPSPPPSPSLERAGDADLEERRSNPPRCAAQPWLAPAHCRLTFAATGGEGRGRRTAAGGRSGAPGSGGRERHDARWERE